MRAAASRIHDGCKLKILIFGPGISGGDLYAKRCEIRMKLKELNHDADFPEEIINKEDMNLRGLNVKVAEEILIEEYDYIINLMVSPGAIGEAHDFAGNRKFAVKMMICVDQNHRNGYSAQGILQIFEGLNGKLDWFDGERDIIECHLSTRIIDQVKRVAACKQMELLGGK